MKVGIYCEVAKDVKPTGIGLHVRHLVRRLGAIDAETEYLLYYPRDLTGPDAGLAGLDGLGPNVRPRPVRFPGGWPGDRPRLWWDHYLPRVLRRDRVDVFHGPNHFLPAFDRGRSVVTIHDVAYFRMGIYGEGEDELLKHLTLQALGRADAVIALSENTRRDVEGLGVEPGRVRVIYGGGNVAAEGDIRRDRREEMRHALKLPDRYVLFVGTIQPRKNVPFLLRGLAELRRRGGPPRKLVLAGGCDAASAAQIDAAIAELGLADDVTITGYVEDWHLPLLYEGADLFVLPTLYEGFTLVTLEAMAYGTPVVATDTSSIREGVGDAALLVPVDDVRRLADAMHAALTDEALRRSLIGRGRDQAGKFTWERMARETLELYRELHAKGR